MSEIVVVKLGGTTLADQHQVLVEVAKVARKRPVVLVHGGGKRMTEWLARLGVETRFENGLRVTDPAALEVAAVGPPRRPGSRRSRRYQARLRRCGHSSHRRACRSG